jgi:hypothetical protein
VGYDAVVNTIEVNDANLRAANEIAYGRLGEGKSFAGADL